MISFVKVSQAQFFSFHVYQGNKNLWQSLCALRNYLQPADFSYSFSLPEHDNQRVKPYGILLHEIFKSVQARRWHAYFQISLSYSSEITHSKENHCKIRDQGLTKTWDHAHIPSASCLRPFFTLYPIRCWSLQSVCTLIKVFFWLVMMSLYIWASKSMFKVTKRSSCFQWKNIQSKKKVAEEGEKYTPASQKLIILKDR